MSGFSTARQKMVDGQVRTNDVTDLKILDAMLTVPREIFVPPGRQALAYLDMDIDVSERGAPKRYLIKPAVTAKMLQAAEVAGAEKVLVVGCATGYIPALVARLAGEVVATEPDPELARRAGEILGRLGLTNVACKVAPCTEGDPAGAPFDVIVLNGATEITPDGLFRQLKEGGRLVGVFATNSPPRAVIVTRTHGEFGHRTLFDAGAPVLPGCERAPAFVF